MLFKGIERFCSARALVGPYRVLYSIGPSKGAVRFKTRGSFWDLGV